MYHIFIPFISLFFLILVIVQKLRKLHQQYAVLPGLKIISSWLLIYSTYAAKNGHLPNKINQIIDGCCKLFENEEMYVFWVAFKPFIVVHKAEAIKILINHPAMYDKSPEYQLGKFCFGEGLTLSNGDINRNRRKSLTPAFNTVAVKEFIHIFNEQSVFMVKKLQGFVHEPSVYMDEIIDLCMIDITCESAMGYRLETQKGNEDGRKFKDALHSIFSLLPSRLFLPWAYFDNLFWISSIGRQCRRDLKITKGLVKKVIEERKKKILNISPSASKDGENVRTAEKKMFIDRLFDHYLINGNFTLENIADEIMTILAAGIETSSITIKNVIFLLGLHPEVQENVIQELDSIFQGDRYRDATHEDLINMKYTDCVIKETLRLFPVVHIFSRELKDDIQVGKHLLPRGSSIAFHLYQLHRDSEFFPNPEKFDPERFSPENNIKRHPFAYLPFSFGGRNCIGQQYAMTELKVLLSHMFRNFRVSSIYQRDQVNYAWEVTLKPTKPLRVHLTPR